MTLIAKYPVYVIEDDPYGELCFDDNPQMPLKSIDQKDQVVYLGSFSKTLSPGLRVAWACSNNEISQTMELLKQGIDLQSSEFTQHQVYSLLNETNFDDHINKISQVYGQKCQLMLEKLGEIKIEGFTYTKPTGGMFVWLELPSNINSNELIDTAIDAGVAYIPGQYFFLDENITNTIRLSFTTLSEEDILRGLDILKGVLENTQD